MLDKCSQADRGDVCIWAQIKFQLVLARLSGHERQGTLKLTDNELMVELFAGVLTRLDVTVQTVLKQCDEQVRARCFAICCVQRQEIRGL